ncbi:HAD family hydrolase [Oceaniglobus trochenteri]|uniref:HAD family hydrolase n=1 Tax=Oceaniglobus trochenteri TaxID=2763260 RepID=UPI001CFFA46F|nr:HAD family phosphatase [Oceaniglobus trochenteri]
MQAILFDLDGTMVHSDPVHAAVFVDLMADYGQTIDASYYVSHLHGRLNVDIFAQLLPDEDPHAMADHKEAMYRERLDEVKIIPGLPAFLDKARARGVKLGVVTNAPRLNAIAVLKAVGLADAFDTVVIGDECARGKPDPLPYLTGLANLGAEAAHAFALEDSPSGISAAKGAGLYTFGVRSSLGTDTLLGAGANDTIDDYNDTALHTYLDRLTGASA